MLELSGEVVVELKEDIPEMILYYIPELPEEDWVQLYNVDKGLHLIYGNKVIILEYIDALLEEYKNECN